MSKINSFQNLLKAKDIDAYMITSSDDHASENIPSYYKTIEYLTGFTGQNTTLIITKEEALLWIDGRFFLQAEIETKDCEELTLMRMGEPLVPTTTQYLKNLFVEYGNLGFDGKLITNREIENIKNEIPNVNLISLDLINDIWDDRPSLPHSIIYQLKEFFSGEETSSKIERVRNELKKENATVNIISALEDQAWLYNLRANDIECTPVFLSFTILTLDEVHLFVDPLKLDDEIRKYLQQKKILVHKYDDFYSYLSELKGEKVLMDYDTCSYTIYRTVYGYNDVIDKKNPTEYLKAIKNDSEIENTKLAHIKDGVAMVKAIKFLYDNVNSLTEISFADVLEAQRRAQQGFIELSFPTIAGFYQHGAIVHYMPTKETNIKLSDEYKTFFLVDSGGHYAQGTTDITRTFALGPVSPEMKLHYTAVLKAAISLASAVFMKGTNGASLDILARKELWKHGLDFKHGTGHGVGHILAVHEGPQRISYHAKSSMPIVPGMITTDEPGLYIEDKYGIRIENELLCVNALSNEYGDFYRFEMLTMCPIDKKAIDVSLLTPDEIDFINRYHEKVYNSLFQHLTKNEAEWLYEACKPLNEE